MLIAACDADSGPPVHTSRVYDPYPPGLLPADLQAEIDRVNTEVDRIFRSALAEWKATPPPTLTGNPPTLQNTGKRLVEILGKLELFDRTISAYEASPDASAFSSKFDAFLAGQAELTADEMAGWRLFRGKAVCNTCHLDGTEHSTTPITRASIASAAPLFTDFTSANLGIPRNPRNPFYFESVPDYTGFTPNPAGAAFTDLGVGLFLRSEAGGVNVEADWTPLAPMFDGKMQVATARNVDLRPCPTFVKAYMHNGYLKSLKEVVHFYNTRDKYASPTCTPRTEKKTCWPPPEVAANKDMTIGNLGLTDAEEDQLVAFLQTLTDGYTRPYTDFNTFTGKCP